MYQQISAVPIGTGDLLDFFSSQPATFASPFALDPLSNEPMPPCLFAPCARCYPVDVFHFRILPMDVAIKK